MTTGNVNRRELAKRLSRGLYFAVVAIVVLVVLQIWLGRWKVEDSIGLLGALFVFVMFFMLIRWLRSHPD